MKSNMPDTLESIDQTIVDRFRYYFQDWCGRDLSTELAARDAGAPLSYARQLIAACGDVITSYD